MHAGDLKQQLAVATAEGAEHNERAIQASTLVDSLQTQVSFSESSHFAWVCQPLLAFNGKLFPCTRVALEHAIVQSQGTGSLQHLPACRDF